MEKIPRLIHDKRKSFAVKSLILIVAVAIVGCWVWCRLSTNEKPSIVVDDPLPEVQITDTPTVVPVPESVEQPIDPFSEVLDLGNGVKLRMIRVTAGSFMMGSPEYELGRYDDEKQHWVTLTQDYWLGETEVTQGQWKAVMNYNPSRSENGDDHPVESVSWDDAILFCKKLNEKYYRRLPYGYKFSLPSEAQWEYACRAGTKTALNNGKNLTGVEYCSNLDEVGWYVKNTGSSTHHVKQKDANGWGFYDMHGNVWEWCSDWYGEYNGDATDPQGASSGSFRVLHGGSWNGSARRCRAACRGLNAPSFRFNTFGFRLAIVPVQ